mmetsp:Transcript_2305/g.6824  ORF Transcript_2305/g.6824 Transcript_2305/m.6824 type:complete len:957 (+) Transcript_2305:91-2961(+)
MAGNKFWGGSESSSSSDSDESSDEAPVAVASAPTGRKVMTRWAEESSSEDEAQVKRVVRSHTDKRYAQMHDRIKQMRNHQKIDDFAALIADYEALLKMYDKLKNVVEQDGGPPPSFVKALLSLDTYVEKSHQEQVENKANKGTKLPENKARAFNTLRAKVRKGNKSFQDLLENAKANPDQIESEPDDEDAASDSSSSSDSEASKSGSGSSSSESDSDSDSDSDGSDSDSSSGKSSRKGSWKSGGDSSDEDDGDEDMAREKKMLRWLITPEALVKLQQKAEEMKAMKEEENSKQKGKGKKAKKDGQGGKIEEKEAKGKEPEDYTEAELMKKVTEISQQRGRRGFDRKVYVDKLLTLMKHAEKQGPRSQLHIMGEIVCATFDRTGSAFEAMRLDLWNEALDKVIKMTPLLQASYDLPKDDEADMDEEDPRSHTRQQILFVSFVEKLDDELYKALQFTQDVYGSEYQEILANCSKFLVVLKDTYKFFEDTQQKEALGAIALRLMEQLYYKPDVLNNAVYEAIHHTLPEEQRHQWIWPEDSKDFMAKLSRCVYAAGEVRLQRRASLCQAYHLALHDHFQNARDLLHLGNLQEQALESDVHTQILYNRVLAQMGLCAFRLGKIQDAHNCLMDVCMHNKARELLAQGLSFSKNMDRTPEQERAERLRQLPYHMHINLEVLESAHHICAMLLEVPNLAMQSIDPNNKRVISKVLRKALEQYDKQVFTGPPENNKEAVVSAAKALQKGDWTSACQPLEDLKVWDHIDPGTPARGTKVKEMIKEKIKTEALRTYLFAYASIYDAFHLDQLVGMFDLQPKTVHSIVSKMMIREEITAFWDESSKFVLVQHVEPTPLQRLALTLADRGAQAVENNERLVDQKTGGFKADQQRQGQGGRWDQAGGPAGGRRFGKGGWSGPGEKGKGKGRGKSSMATSGPPKNRGWENARAGAVRGSTGQRGWSTTVSR